MSDIEKLHEKEVVKSALCQAFSIVPRPEKSVKYVEGKPKPAPVEAAEELVEAFPSAASPEVVSILNGLFPLAEWQKAAREGLKDVVTRSATLKEIVNLYKVGVVAHAATGASLATEGSRSLRITTGGLSLPTPEDSGAGSSFPAVGS